VVFAGIVSVMVNELAASSPRFDMLMLYVISAPRSTEINGDSTNFEMLRSAPGRAATRTLVERTAIDASNTATSTVQWRIFGPSN